MWWASRDPERELEVTSLAQDCITSHAATATYKYARRKVSVFQVLKDGVAHIPSTRCQETQKSTQEPRQKASCSPTKPPSSRRAAPTELAAPPDLRPPALLRPPQSQPPVTYQQIHTHRRHPKRQGSNDARRKARAEPQGHHTSITYRANTALMEHDPGVSRTRDPRNL